MALSLPTYTCMYGRVRVCGCQGSSVGAIQLTFEAESPIGLELVKWLDWLSSELPGDTHFYMPFIGIPTTNHYA